MIPKSKQKAEKREILVNNIEKMVALGYQNIEISDILYVHRNVVSGLRIKKTEYPISLEKLDSLILESQDFLDKIS